MTALVQSGALTVVEGWLNRHIGLNQDSIGSSAVLHAVEARMEATGVYDGFLYADLLEESAEEGQALIEAIVVPETWFFRDQQPFEMLSRWVLKEWMPGHPDRELRVLSMPCSTGEEPYSVAMTLLSHGIARFEVEGVDISAVALQRAREGLYRRNSFRGTSLDAWQQFFRTVLSGESWQITNEVRRCVRFTQENLLNPAFARRGVLKDVILCRNLLIYMDAPAQRRLLETIDQLLAPNGLLIVGHAEAYLVSQFGFESAGVSMAFAFRKKGAVTRPRSAVSFLAPTVVPRSAESRATSLPEVGVFSVRLSTPPAVPKTRRQEARPQPLVPTKVAKGVMGAENPHLDECQRLADAGALTAATQQCEACVREQGPSARAYYLLGLIQDAQGEVDAAMGLYRKALYLDPECSEALAQMTLILRRKGDPSKAHHLQRRLERLELKRLQEGV